MHPTKSCKTCDHAEPIQVRQDGVVETVECRADLPHVIVGQARNLAQQTVPICLGAFPQINASVWCHKWTPREDPDDERNEPIELPEQKAEKKIIT